MPMVGSYAQSLRSYFERYRCGGALPFNLSDGLKCAPPSAAWENADTIQAPYCRVHPTRIPGSASLQIKVIVPRSSNHTAGDSSRWAIRPRYGTSNRDGNYVPNFHHHTKNEPAITVDYGKPGYQRNRSEKKPKDKVSSGVGRRNTCPTLMSASSRIVSLSRKRNPSIGGFFSDRNIVIPT
ncbi:hypothetical protein B9Z19DRAFT_286106 [Tuber borchii]|uniref:Uncharacterized protein n=1 Tax=Tuber borchii TaxID=42251 RepID=A0A2T6ZKM1_TUBBO|nr:hypothetical protein B9Z19DRAFT_286106 [Tuber borchii]